MRPPAALARGSGAREGAGYSVPAIWAAQSPHFSWPRSLRLVVPRRGDGGDEATPDHANHGSVSLRYPRLDGRFSESGDADSFREVRGRSCEKISVGARIHTGERDLRGRAQQRMGWAMERAIEQR